MKFMNLNKWLYSNPQEEAGAEDNGGSGGQPLSFASQEELDAYVASKQATQPPTAQPPKDKVSITEERQRQQNEQQNQKDFEKRTERAVTFNATFDSFIEENKDYFPESTKSIRGDVKTDDLFEKTSLIAATAAKEYFSIPRNLESLTTADRERVEREILNVRYESDIDGLAVWELIERSIYGNQLADKHKKANDFIGKGGKGTTGFQHVDNHLKKFFPESVVSVDN